MSSPATLAREAKDIHTTLKGLLKANDPNTDREQDFQRKNLRRRYLSLLLVHPYAKESKDAETHLWMQTSYAFIAVYKQRIAALDRSPRPQQQQHHRGNDPGPVEYRKVLQRFRQFLADEEKFWTQLIVRFTRIFSLEEVQPHLVALGILTTGTDGKVIDEVAENPSNARNHYQFPPIDDTVPLAPSTPAQKETRLAIMSKALICLGDIARYREQYNEAGGRPKAGQEDIPGPARRGRNRRGGSVGMEAGSRPRNYERAKNCYERAQILVPQEGNPSHQLAILASYQKDPFTSLVHYHRSLCVRQPYETALENMGTVMSKTLDQWKRKDSASREPHEGAVPKLRIDLLKEKSVVLHALWRLGMEKMDSLYRKLVKSIHGEFRSLVSGRNLPEDLISDFVVLSEAALWRHQTSGEPAPRSKQKGKQDAPIPTLLSPDVVRRRIISHILSIHSILLQVGVEQLEEPLPPDVANGDLAQHITAVFRRTLPALRIASKWLKANFHVVLQFSAETSAAQVSPRKHGDTHEVSFSMTRFWTTFTKFIRLLSQAFPLDRLPPVRGVLEEDVRMRGFLPLNDLLDERQVSGQPGEHLAPMENQVHPNVLQLMRICDLLADAHALVEINDSPLTSYGQQIMLKGVESEQRIQPYPAANSISSKRLFELDDELIREDAARTDDEVVRDAFRFLDGSDQDAEDDEIVYLRTPTSPPLSTSPRTSPTLQKAVGSPSKVHNSPTKPISLAATTAQDLLNDVMGRRGSGDISRTPGLSSSLFGSNSKVPGQTIWSASQDEQALRFSHSAAAQIHLPSPQLLPLAPEAVAPPWQGPIPGESGNFSHHLHDMHPMAISNFARPQQRLPIPYHLPLDAPMGFQPPSDLQGHYPPLLNNTHWRDNNGGLYQDHLEQPPPFNDAPFGFNEIPTMALLHTNQQIWGHGALG